MSEQQGPSGSADARPRTWQSVLGSIEDQLADGRLRTGDRLPAERTLAESLGVSRSSVREALRVLEAFGVVRTTGGQGRESHAVLVTRPQDAVGAALRMHVASSALSVQDVVDTRVVLEIATAQRLSARLATTPDGAELLAPARDLLTAMRDPDLSPEQFHRLDVRFHLSLAEAAGNAVVTVMMSSLRESIEGYVLAAVPLLPDWNATSSGLRLQHAAVLTALRKGDGARAGELLEAHIRGFHELTSR